MSDKPDLLTERDLAPEDIAAHGFFSREEKIGRLTDMKFELERQTARGTASLDQVEARMAAINHAIARVKSEDPGYDDANAMGRTSSA